MRSYANEIMHHSPPTVTADYPVTKLAEDLLRTGADGLCVVDGDKLVGVVTSMDLIYQEKPVHLPTFLAFVDSLLPSSNRKEFEKVTGLTVADIMTRKPLTVAFDAALEDVAALMVEKHVTIVPVVKGDRLVGVITKPDMLRAAFQKRQD